MASSVGKESTPEMLDSIDEFFSLVTHPTLVFLRINTKPIDCITREGERVTAYTAHCWHDESGEVELIIEYFEDSRRVQTLHFYELYMYAAIVLYKYGFRRASTYELDETPTIKAFARD